MYMCVYSVLQILSHLPVEAAAIGLGYVTSDSDAIQDLRYRLNQSMDLPNLTAVCAVVIIEI